MSCTTLQQDFVIYKVGSKHLMMNVLGVVHPAEYFWFAVIMSWDWHPCSVWKPLGHHVCCTAVGLDLSFDRKQDQRACIWQRHQDWREIAEYSDRVDSMRLSMTHSILEELCKQIVFSCVVTLSLSKRSLWRLNWKFHALQCLHWLFLCFGCVETWERYEPKTSGPYSANCELCAILPAWILVSQ